MSDQNQYHFVFTLFAKKAYIEKDSLSLEGIDPKIAYMTARPGRDRAFISAERFINTWVKNESVFAQNLPEIAMIYSAMPVNKNKEAKAIPFMLSKAEKVTHTKWRFQLIDKHHVCSTGDYDEVILFIDWLPALKCPEPIKLLVPSLFSKKD